MTLAYDTHLEPPRIVKPEYDTVGYWSEVKIEIVRAYATEYSKIMAKQSFKHIYIDGFAGQGVNLSRTSGEYIPGSPLNALLVRPPFREVHFIDADENRAERVAPDRWEPSQCIHLRRRLQRHPAKEGIPSCRVQRLLTCTLSSGPLNINLSWHVVSQAGAMKTIGIFLNFMIMDINMNVLRHNPEKVNSRQIERMNRFWGDGSWRDVAYDKTGNLFGWDEKVPGNEPLVRAYRQRLRDVAGFKHVPEPIPMRNTKGATVYYLFFASPNATGSKIVEYIFNKYRDRGLH